MDYSFRGCLPWVVVIEVYRDRENGVTSLNRVWEKLDIDSPLLHYHTFLDFAQT